MPPRWRPPQPRSSPYITPEGERTLREELKSLWQQRRREVVPALSAAAAEGDRSENAEYIYRKKQLAEIDRRVRYLSRRLDEVVVVRQSPPDGSRVFFGARIQLLDTDGETRRYRIVGADETSAREGLISIDSPMAQALLGKRRGDTVSVQLPEGEAEFRVLEIDYFPVPDP
jgi:transcription elongation factor GreB